MIQIRRNVFETNSSSTHSICIAKSNDYVIPGYLHFTIGEFGWEERFIYNEDELASYLYTAILCCYDEKEREDFKNYIYEVLGKNGCNCTFEPPVVGKWGLENGYIDHANDCADFLDAVRKSEKALLRFLFSPDSFIITGNDNSDWFDEMECDTDFSKVDKYFKWN